MSTANIIAEREFAKFDHTEYWNKNFSAKGIRAEMMLYKSSDEIVGKFCKTKNHNGAKPRSKNYSRVLKKNFQKKLNVIIILQSFF